MKCYIASLLFLLFSSPIFSQWGIKGGISISDVSGLRSPKQMVSAHLGGSYDIELAMKWFFQPGLQLTSVGFNLNDDHAAIRDGKLRIYAIESPQIFSFRPPIGNLSKLIIDLGTYARYGLWGKKTYNYYNSASINKSPFDTYNRFDAGTNVGLGLQQKHFCGIITFQRGLTEAEKDLEVFHQTLKISVGYNF